MKPITWSGKTQPIRAWAEELGIPAMTLYQRISAGWDIDRAMSTPTKPNPMPGRFPKIRVGRRSLTCGEWAAVTGVPAHIIRSRLGHGMRPREAVSAPVKTFDYAQTAGMRPRDLARELGIPLGRVRRIIKVAIPKPRTVAEWRLLLKDHPLKQGGRPAEVFDDDESGGP